MDYTSLKITADALQSKAGLSTPANQSESGWWLQIATAAESIAGVSTAANPTVTGYMLRAAKALEAYYGGSGAEENASYEGFLERIADAMELNTLLTPTGNLANRIRASSLLLTTTALSLPFSTMSTLDSRITFTRASTATYFDSAGVMQTASANIARLDHNPSTLAPLGLLIEEARTNLLLFSAAFDNAHWTKSDVTLALNAIGLFGPNTAWTATEAATNNSHIIGTTVTVAVGNNVIYWDVKAGTCSTVQILCDAKSGGLDFANFNLSTGTIGTFAASAITPFIVNLGNGFYRCGMVIAGDVAGSVLARIYMSQTASDARNPSYLGTGRTIIVADTQVEAGAFATSYIPTVAATVTRAADSASMSYANLRAIYNDSEGTWVAEGDSAQAATGGVFIGISLVPAIYIGPTQSSYFPAVGANASFATTYPVANARTKIAFAYKANDAAVSANGAVAATDATLAIETLAVGVVLNIGTANGTGNNINGHIKSLTYFNTRKTNAELVTLST